ncbi:putative monocarboxylate transporter 12-like [Apostichopus japonicus]|uniref:Putative monocarboxylate transporter 12-like n=1 Tax=Stichopus japonicus TaxID=307972 RepID=A0A2G8KKQ0_STIJA|nr:putative monocarboxylate transporter 12-like [Apostichopus japonicus]
MKSQPDWRRVRLHLNLSTNQGRPDVSNSDGILDSVPRFLIFSRITFFILFCLSNFVMCIGYQLPYMYFKAFALSLNVSEKRLVLHSIHYGDHRHDRTDHRRLYIRTNHQWIRPSLGFMCASILSGIFLFLLSFSTEFNSLTILASCYSLLAGSTDSLVPALLAHFVGIDTLAYSFGMVIEMQGSGFLIGPPIAGREPP